MNHPAFEIINEFYDGTLDLSSTDELERHLDICPSCRNMVEELHNIGGLMIGLEDLNPSCNLVPKIQTQIYRIRLWNGWKQFLLAQAIISIFLLALLVPNRVYMARQITSLMGELSGLSLPIIASTVSVSIRSAYELIISKLVLRIPVVSFSSHLGPGQIVLLTGIAALLSGAVFIVLLRKSSLEVRR